MHLFRDLRYGVRTLAKSPAFTAVAVISLALGIGANTALFSLMDVMLLRTLPVKNPQELVEFVRAHPDGALMSNLPQAVFEYFQRDRAVLSDVFAISPSNPVFRAGGAPERIRSHEVSGSFFPSLGVQPLRGRAIGPDDDHPGAANRVAVLSHAFWSREFGRAPSALGARVRIGGEQFTVIGIMPPDFFGADRASLPDLWIPFSVETRARQAWVIGRLRPGVSIASARAQLDPLFRQALESMRDGLKLSSESERSGFFAQRLLVNPAASGNSNVRWSYWEGSGTLKILIGLTGLVLLIACANLANLLMARSAARSREIAIRLALGAGRWRLIRQLMTENLLLSLTGGALGLLMAGWGHELMLRFLLRDPLTAALDFRLDYRVLGFSLALSVATGLLFGLLPAIRATQTAKPVNTPVAKGLLGFQIGLSMVLLIFAGLFSKSLLNLGSADLGLARDNLLLIDIRPPESHSRFWSDLTRRTSNMPGVRSAALAGDAVFGNGDWNQTVWIARSGQPPLDARISDNVVGLGFFATTSIPLLAGREFGEQDRADTPLVAVVNQTFARRFFGNESPIGRRFGDRGAGSAARYEIVGVVADAKYGSVREQPRPMAFYPLAQDRGLAKAVLHVCTLAEPAAIRREIQAVDSETLISDIRTLPQIVHTQLRQDRMFATLAGFFALLALALGAIGIYGMLAFRVARRTAEIGIRMALGAQPGDVRWLILRESLFLLAAGSIGGIPAAILTARLLKGLLFGLQPWDPAVLVCATAVLFAGGALAGFLPARRAARLDPASALRAD